MTSFGSWCGGVTRSLFTKGGHRCLSVVQLVVEIIAQLGEIQQLLGVRRCSAREHHSNTTAAPGGSHPQFGEYSEGLCAA